MHVGAGGVRWGILASGKWTVPRFHGVVSVEMPPLLYWLTAATSGVAGPS